MSNTTVTIKYSSGSTREFVASDELEKLINEGEMFSVSTLHSDISIDEEVKVSKMYSGNSMSALGHMILMKRNAEQLLKEDETMNIFIEAITACISLLSNEITSHQSGMSPVKSSVGAHEVRERHDEMIDLESTKSISDNQVKCPAINIQCDYFTYQLDSNGEVAINHCDHRDNSNKNEGNCTSLLCPLLH